MTGSHSTTLDDLRQQDPNGYRLSFFVRAEHRPAIQALFAFQAEIASIRSKVTDTTMGLIRLTWWRESIEDIFNGKPVKAHDVLTALARAIKRYDLVQKDFETLIYAREFDLEGVLPMDLKGVENYLDFTTRPLLNLIIKCLGGSVDEVVLKPMAQMIGMARLLRKTPYDIQNDCCYYPQDLLDEAGLDIETLYQGRGVDALKSVTCDLVWAADTAYKEIQGKSFSKELRVLAVYVALSRQHLNMLRAQDFDVFSSKFNGTPPLSMLRLIARFYWNQL